MKGTRPIINVVLTIVVLGLGYYLYVIIQEPIIFQKEKDTRYALVIKKLKDIRQAQLAYKDLTGKFANNFNDLIHTISNDSFPLIKAIGEAPDSLTEEQATLKGLITRDTTLVPMIVHTFAPPKRYVEQPDRYRNELKNYIDSTRKYVATLSDIPFSDNAKFEIDAGEIEKNKVTIQVFEVNAPEKVVLAGLNEKYIDDKHIIRVGSMIEGTYTGNWE